MKILEKKDILLGMIDYIKSPRKKNSWGGAFNNQEFRKKIFHELMGLFQFQGIIETGTYRGTTTNFLHTETGLPIYTVENHPRFYGFSKLRFFQNPDVSVELADSRDFLNLLAQDTGLSKKRLFFYLDAHWEKDLPLAEEIVAIFQTWPDAVILVDDFQVPSDDSYEFDDYGEDASLTLDYLNNFTNLPMDTYFPALSGQLETGGRRGCVVLGHHSMVIEQLNKAATIIRYQ